MIIIDLGMTTYDEASSQQTERAHHLAKAAVSLGRLTGGKAVSQQTRRATLSSCASLASNYSKNTNKSSVAVDRAACVALCYISNAPNESETHPSAILRRFLFGFLWPRRAPPSRKNNHQTRRFFHHPRDLVSESLARRGKESAAQLRHQKSFAPHGRC